MPDGSRMLWGRSGVARLDDAEPGDAEADGSTLLVPVKVGGWISEHRPQAESLLRRDPLEGGEGSDRPNRLGPADTREPRETRLAADRLTLGWRTRRRRDTIQVGRRLSDAGRASR